MNKHSQEVCSKNRRAVQDTLDVIGGKWKVLILLTLNERPYRFKELAREINITPRMLARELQEMEINKLVKRQILDTKPIGVEYSITTHGLTFKEVIEALRDWGVKHKTTLITT